MADDEFQHFVRVNGAALQRAAFLLTGDVYLAQDLVQSALIKTGLAWSRLDDQANALAYTRKVLHHEHISWWRRRRVLEQLSDQLAETEATGDEYAAVDQRLVVRAALLRLPSRQRAVVVCRFFDDLTEAETAHVLDMAIGTVKSQTHRALASLRGVLPELSTLTEEL